MDNNHADGAGRTILLVEDDAMTSQALTDALTEEGYTVRQATDGMAALTAMHDDVPQLVVADVHMPRLNGGQLVRRLRQWNVPVIMVSADRNWSRTPGVVFLAKPVHLDHFLSVVDRFFDHQHTAGTPT